MSRKLAVVLLLVLVGAMGLRTAITAHGDNSVLIASGGPPPPSPWK